MAADITPVNDVPIAAHATTMNAGTITSCSKKLRDPSSNERGWSHQ
jgi:hypothetical protein